MPNVVLSSRLKNTDSVFLDEWIWPSVYSHYLQGKRTKLWICVPRIVKELHMSADMDALYITALSRATSRFVRIIKFHKVDQYNVYATIRDSKVLILCHFTSRCVLDYESAYHSRITLNTVNTLFVIGNVTLEFWNHKECNKCFDLQFSNLKMVPVLRIEQARIFDRDQIGSTKNYQWIYRDLS